MHQGQGHQFIGMLVRRFLLFWRVVAPSTSLLHLMPCFLGNLRHSLYIPILPLYFLRIQCTRYYDLPSPWNYLLQSSGLSLRYSICVTSSFSAVWWWIPSIWLWSIWMHIGAQYNGFRGSAGSDCLVPASHESVSLSLLTFLLELLEQHERCIWDLLFHG
jgi:hypothetical protein